MHKGEYKGDKATLQKHRILILGESHHVNKKDPNNTTPGKEATYYTWEVLKENYKDKPNERNLRFFHKIAQSFGVAFEPKNIDLEFEKFWDKVYFGNYVEVLCGVKDDKAEIQIKAHREEYNDNLFKYINDNQIEYVFCFSRKVFNNLPSLANTDEKRPNIDDGNITVGKKRKVRDRIEYCVFSKETNHDCTNVKLNCDLNVYSLRHPSAIGGFKVENYKGKLQKIFLECTKD